MSFIKALADMSKEEIIAEYRILNDEYDECQNAATRNAVKMTRLAQWNRAYMLKNDKLEEENRFFKKTLVKLIGATQTTQLKQQNTQDQVTTSRTQHQPSTLPHRPQLKFTTSDEEEEASKAE